MILTVESHYCTLQQPQEHFLSLMYISVLCIHLFTHTLLQVLLCNKHVVEQLQHTDCDGKTPLMLAAQNGHLE